jgi:hypothetical protein
MKRRVVDWTIEQLQKSRADIGFPEYQRQGRLWTDERKQLLISSILEDVDIPKLYFNKASTGEFEVIDGQQRLWTIWDFLDDEFAVSTENGAKHFSELEDVVGESILKFALQVVELEQADDDYLRKLFLRLQLGLLLVTGEKLNAATGAMKDFVFGPLAEHAFLRGVKIPDRRYARQTLGAQVAVNAFARAKSKQFARTRYEDLLYFFEQYERPQGDEREFFERECAVVTSVLDLLTGSLGARSGELTSRAYILSVYLLCAANQHELIGGGDTEPFGEFVVLLWRRLRAEMSAGFDRVNRELYRFETKLSSAPGERYQIEGRHELLVEYYAYFKEHGKIKGDA